MAANAGIKNRLDLFTGPRHSELGMTIPTKHGLTDPPFYFGESQFQTHPDTRPKHNPSTSGTTCPPSKKSNSVSLPISSPQFMNLSLENQDGQCEEMKIENGNKKDAQISNLKRLSSIELNTNVKKIFYESRPKKKILFGLDTPDFFHMKEILDAFAFTTGKLNPYSQIAQNMIQHHLRVRHLDKTTLISQLSLLASVIAEFAGSQYIFACLCKEDQKILLQNNIPLYLQYILAQYFSSCSGLEQISWILEGQVSLQTIEDVTNLNLISLSELNTAVCLYNSSTLVQLYQHFSDNIRY
jgi:hypothetical protein